VISTETNVEAWQRRTARPGSVDFTMMYVAHDAFTRDLARLLSAARRGSAQSTEAKATWQMFNRQLTTHHETEDASLWPRLRSVVTLPDEMTILDDMEAEHESLDPLLEGVDDSLVRGSSEPKLVDQLEALATSLGAHMRHEEMAALPLIERRIGQSGWDAFGKDIRSAVGGMSAGPQYLPWVLDGAPEPARKAVLGLLPPPVRLLYKRWEAKYRSSVHLV
jgi:hemerythrin-like domain-containing protein